MSLRTRDWHKVLGLAQARAGCELDHTETKRLSFLLNSAAQIINDASPYWPRLLALQPRRAKFGFIPFSEVSDEIYYLRSYNIPDANGIYDRLSTDSNGFKRWYLIEDSPKGFNYVIANFFGLGGAWGLWESIDSQIAGEPPLELDLGGPEDNSIFPLDWGTLILERLYEIDECIEVWDGPKWGAGQVPGQINDHSSFNKLNWYATSSGIQLTNPQSQKEHTVFVGFKRDLTEEYGDGSNGTTVDVPNEWADFMAYHAARSWQDAQGSNFQAQGIALSQINRVLEDQLLKINRENAMQVLSSYFQTYYNSDYSVR